jgi:hypothetical protein
MIESVRPLNRREASAYLFEKYGHRFAPSTLAKFACVGGGPEFRKVRRSVIYDVAALDAFAGEITSAAARSTAEHAQRRDEVRRMLGRL